MTRSESADTSIGMARPKVKQRLVVPGVILVVVGIALGGLVGVGVFASRVAELSWKSVQRDAELVQGSEAHNVLYVTSVASLFAASVRTDNVDTALRVSCDILEGNVPRIPSLEWADREIYRSAKENLEWLRGEGHCTE